MFDIEKLQKRIDAASKRAFGNELDYTGKELVLKEVKNELEEKGNDIIARFRVPNVERKDIKVDITRNRIEVKVERKYEKKTEGKGFFKEEKGYRGFFKYLSLPKPVIPEKAKTRYSNGLLEVVMPKAEKRKKGKVIKIK